MNPNNDLNSPLGDDHAHDDEHDLGLSHDLARLTATMSSMSSMSSMPSPRPNTFQHQPMFVGASSGVSGGPRAAAQGFERSYDRRDLLRFALFAGVAGTMTVGGLRRGANAQTTTAAACVDIPEETAGPYPGDGTNGPNVLTTAGVVRSDIRSSFGSLSGTAAGVPLTVSLTLTDSASCSPAKGYAVYLWHADQEGRYSLYSSGVTNQNYLRGVQEADANGVVTFTTVFPGCYDGRWPHIHFEVYPSLAAAGDASKRIATSQLAFPKSACDAAYATSGYSASMSNLTRTSLASDGIFSDDTAGRQVAAVTGSARAGFAATLPVSVSNTVKASGSAAGPGGGGRGPAPGAAPATTVASTTVAAKKATTTTKKKATTTKKKATAKKVTTTLKKK